MPDVTIKQHDTWPPLPFTLTDNERTITSISKQTSTVTVTTATAHSLATGDYVYIYNTANFTDNIARNITVTGLRTFTYTDTDSTSKPTETTGLVRRGVDLTSATSIKIILKGTTVVVTGTCVKDPTQTTNRGKATYTFIAADTALTGLYDMEFEVNWGGSPAKIETFPNQGYASLEIKADLG